MNHLPKIGAFVLETLTTGMYTNPLDTLREFVQNSSDSIRHAEVEGILINGEGRIEVIIDPNQRKLIIKDNGLGIPQNEVYARLINIGVSNKQFTFDAGFRGIGRLAGIAYCKSLYFRTSKQGEATASKVSMDCEGLKKSMSPSMRQVEELADVMARYSSITTERCKPEEHFFEVVMEGIAETAPVFLDWKLIENYLCQVAPVEYDAQRFVFATKITEWMRQSSFLTPTVTLILKTPEMERQVFKSYKTHYKTSRGDYKIDIKDICFFPNEPLPEMQFWLWYGKTDLLGMIEDERASGLRIRKNNISIGGQERVSELFADVAESNRRFNSWYIGEVHIVTPSAIPNARRDGFEDVGAWPEIKSALMPFIKERCEEVRSLSEARNRPTAKIVATATSVIDDAVERMGSGIVSKEERDSLLERVTKEEERAKRALETRKDPSETEVIEPIINKLEEVRNSLEQEKHFAVKKLRTNLDRKQRKVVAEILKILYETLDEVHFKKAKAAILAKFQINESDTE